jgi:hypothetical protein
MSRRRKKRKNKLQLTNQIQDRDMRYNRQKQTIETDESIPDLLECSYEYSIKETTASMTWKGPKIPQEVWYAITSFFKWTYDTTKSESQVRLYVSPTHQTWKAWAFPQEAETGMSARELPNEDAQRQRQELALNPPEWFYFGTVHHHCGMSAFQSGTDEENEKNQDGLHITVGNLDKPQYDIHARFYRKTMKFEKTLNLSLFFDIGDVLVTWPEMFKNYMPKDIEHQTAIKLMGKPVTVEFPDQWKANLVFKPKTPPTSNRQVSIPAATSADIYSSEIVPTWKRGTNAWREIIAKAVTLDIAATDIMDAIQDMGMEGFAYNTVLKACLHHKVDLDDLIRQQPNNVELDMAELQAKIELEDEQNRKNPTSGNGANHTRQIPEIAEGDGWNHMHIS